MNIYDRAVSGILAETWQALLKVQLSDKVEDLEAAERIIYAGLRDIDEIRRVQTEAAN